MGYFIGIDVGTTNIKAAAFTIEGAMASFASRPFPVDRPSPDRWEISPEKLWETVCLCTREALAGLGGGEVLGASVSSMGEAGLPVDKAGRALHPIIVWHDPRSQPQAEQLEARLGKRRIFELSGQLCSSKHGITKTSWIKENKPEALDEAVLWLSVGDYVLFRLSGEAATDYSLASRTMAFDIRKLDWSEEILAAAGIPKRLFPKALPGGTRCGKVSDRGSEASGLPKGCVLATGGHDHACAAIGVNLFRDGTVLDSMGTAEASMIASPAPVLTDEAFDAFAVSYPHCGKKLYRHISSLQTSGASVEWFLNSFGPFQDRDGNAKSYEGLFLEAASAEAPVPGPLFFPFLRGCVENPEAGACFFGIRDCHSRADFARAVFEGLAFEERILVERFEKIFGERYRSLRVVGGASRSDYWMQTKATFMERTMEIPEVREAACFGAALLAAAASGEIGLDDLGSICRTARSFQPKAAPSLAERYGRYSRVRAFLMERP